jgi:transposase
MRAKVDQETIRKIRVLVGQGYTYKAIGERLGVSKNAVARHAQPPDQPARPVGRPPKGW